MSSTGSVSRSGAPGERPDIGEGGEPSARAGATSASPSPSNAALVGITRQQRVSRAALDAARTAVRPGNRTAIEALGKKLLDAAHRKDPGTGALASSRPAPAFDPMLEERVRTPGGLERVIADIHTHDRGYDFRRPFTFRHLQDRTPKTALNLHGSIPQFCGEAHYSSVNAPKLIMRYAGKMDRRVGRDYASLYAGYVKAKKNGDAEQASELAIRLARADLSFTGVDPSKPGSVAYMKKTMLEHPGVFVGLGEWTGDKEFVSTLLGDEAFKFGDPESLAALGFAQESGLVTLIHNDWGRHGINEHDLRPEARRVAYEHFDRLIDAVGQFPNANIVLAHTGIGRFARPDDALTKIEVSARPSPLPAKHGLSGLLDRGKAKLGLGAPATETIEVPEHIAKLYEAVQRAPNVRFDISWNDVGEAYMSNPKMREALVDFIVRHPDKVLFGSDTVKPVNAGQYNQALTLIAPLIADVARRDPEAAYALVRGNYEAITDDARKRSTEWTVKALTKQFDATTSKRERKTIVAKLEQVEGMDALRAPVRESLRREARACFDEWVALVDGTASNPPARSVASAGVSAFQAAHDGLPAAQTQTWEGDRYGAGTARGRQGDMSKVKATAWTAGAAVAAAGAVMTGVEIHSVPIAATLALGQAGFAARGMLNAGRAIYTEGLRDKSDRMFEWADFTDKDLNVFMERLRNLGPQFGVDPERIDAAERLTDQFRANHARLTAMPASSFETIASDPAVGVTNEDRERQKFNVIMSEVGRYQINLDRALGLQATSINATDPRTRSGRLIRGLTAASLFVNVTDTAALLATTHGQNPAAVAFSVLFGVANTALLGSNLVAYAGGKEKMNLETDGRSPLRAGQAATAAALAVASGPWLLSDGAGAVHTLLQHHDALTEAKDAVNGAFQLGTEAAFGAATAKQAIDATKAARGGQMPSGAARARPIVEGNAALVAREGVPLVTPVVRTIGHLIAPFLRRG
jgi:predicted TIM-barrel fold metal-dependent hydrolase